MAPFWFGKFGNPTSLYSKGREAREAVEESRKAVAELISAKPQEIIFTAGGTESINLAIFGVARWALKLRKKVHVIASAIEHHAVLHSVRALEQEGCAVTLLPVDSEGFVSLDVLKIAIRPETILISIMSANNEIGTIEPVSEIGKWLKQLNSQRVKRGLATVLFHTDACQAAGVLDLSVQRLGVDLMSVNASKIYGPKQVGFLYMRTGVALYPLVYGGGQEKDLRSGTENVPGIVGFAESFRLAQTGREKENKRLITLRDYFITKISNLIPNAILNGPNPKTRSHTASMSRLPNNVNFSFFGIEGETLQLYLDSYNISVSTGSACTSTSQDPSHVILAIGRKKGYVDGSLRFTLGKGSTKQEIDYALKVLPGIVDSLRKVKQLKKY